MPIAFDIFAEGGEKGEEEEEEDDDLELLLPDCAKMAGGALECRLLETAHAFVTLRSQKKWAKVVEMCDWQFRYSISDKHSAQLCNPTE